MKTEYIQPSIEVVEIELEGLIATSYSVDKDEVIWDPEQIL